MPPSGCKSLRRFRKAGARRMDAPRGRALQGCYLRPSPISRKELAEGTAKRRFTAGSPGCQGGGD